MGVDMTDAEMDSVESLVVQSKVKAVVKEKGLQTAGDAIDALNKKVRAIVEEAVARAQANRRSTVKPQDI
jgi:histone H3/H4